MSREFLHPSYSHSLKTLSLPREESFCLCLCGPAMNWQAVQGVTRVSAGIIHLLGLRDKTVMYINTQMGPNLLCSLHKSAKGHPVLLLRTTLKMWLCANGLSLWVCSERETRGQGILSGAMGGPIDCQWPASSSTCHWVAQLSYGYSPTAGLHCFLTRDPGGNNR